MKAYNCPDCKVPSDTCDGCQRAVAACPPSNNEDWKKLFEKPSPTILPSTWEYPSSISDIPPCCQGCSNHPSNGGSGICHCTLPYMHGYGVTYSSGEYKILTTDDINGNIITTVVRSN